MFTHYISIFYPSVCHRYDTESFKIYLICPQNPDGFRLNFEARQNTVGRIAVRSILFIMRKII